MAQDKVVRRRCVEACIARLFDVTLVETMAPVRNGFEPSGLERYRVVCNGITHNLLLWSLSAILPIDPQALKKSIEDGYAITAT